MPRKCTICIHKERLAIEQAVIAGGTYRGVAKRYDLSVMSLYRHTCEHLSEKLIKASETRSALEGDILAADLSNIREKTNAVLNEAENTGNHELMLRAIREARANLELYAKIEGRLKDYISVNIVHAPQYIEIRSAILGALEPYREARVAVAEALEASNY